MSTPRRVRSGKNNRRGWQFRFTDPFSGRRKKRTYWYQDKDEAAAAHGKFLNSRQRALDGLPNAEAWTTPYPHMVQAFLQQAELSDERRANLKRWLDENEFNIHIARDLLKLGPLNKAAKDLADKLGANYVRKCAQGALKQMTRWLAEHQILETDPLAYWKRVKAPPAKKPKAFTPEEVRAILDAADELAQIGAERGSLRQAWVTLLVSGNRPGAVFKATVKDLVGYKDAYRIELPPGEGKKRNGLAALPHALGEELLASIEARKAGADEPLLVSANGSAIDRNNAKRNFERCMALAFVRMLWPEDAPDGVEPYSVMTLLLTGRQRGFDGPAPKDPKKIKARALRVKLTADIEEEIREEWLALMEGRYMYRLRATHISWARGRNVNEDSVDLQVGHAPDTMAEKHYLALVDPSRSAAEVWAALHEEPEPEAQRKVVGLNEQVPQQGPPIDGSGTTKEPSRSGEGRGSTYEKPVPSGQTRSNAFAAVGLGVQEVAGSNPVAPTNINPSRSRGFGKLPKGSKFHTSTSGAATGAAKSAVSAVRAPSLDDILPPRPEVPEELRLAWAELPEHVQQSILLLARSAARRDAGGGA